MRAQTLLMQSYGQDQVYGQTDRMVPISPRPEFSAGVKIGWIPSLILKNACVKFESYPNFFLSKYKFVILGIKEPQRFNK